MKMSRKEVEKVSHDINNIWHTKFQNEKRCVIYTHSHKSDSPSYEYHFLNYGFNNYEFVGKFPTKDRR